MEHDEADLYFESVETIRGELKRRLKLELDEHDNAAIDTAILAAAHAGYRNGVGAADLATETEAATVPLSCPVCGTAIPAPEHSELPVEEDRDPWEDWDRRFGEDSAR